MFTTFRLCAYHLPLLSDDRRPNRPFLLRTARNMPETFTCFPKLPFELRRIIWKQTFPASRYMREFYLPHEPIALRVNREARAVAMEHYERVPDHDQPVGDPLWRGSICFNGFIDYKIDFRYVTQYRPCEKVMRKPSNIILEDWNWAKRDDDRTAGMLLLALDEYIEGYPSLKTVVYQLHYPEARDDHSERRAPVDVHVAVQFLKAQANNHVARKCTSPAQDGMLRQAPAVIFEKCEGYSGGCMARYDGDPESPCYAKLL